MRKFTIILEDRLRIVEDVKATIRESKKRFDYFVNTKKTLNEFQAFEFKVNKKCLEKHLEIRLPGIKNEPSGLILSNAVLISAGHVLKNQTVHIYV